MLLVKRMDNCVCTALTEKVMFRKKDTPQQAPVLTGMIFQNELAGGLPLPSPGHPDDVAMDIPVAVETVVPARGNADVRTGIHVVPPDGYYFRVVGKGSSAGKNLYFTLEIIDPGYRGEVILRPGNASDEDVTVPRGKCIAQLELVKINRSIWQQVERLEELGQTARGAGRDDSTKTGIR